MISRSKIRCLAGVSFTKKWSNYAIFYLIAFLCDCVEQSLFFMKKWVGPGLLVKCYAFKLGRLYLLFRVKTAIINSLKYILMAFGVKEII